MRILNQSSKAFVISKKKFFIVISVAYLALIFFIPIIYSLVPPRNSNVLAGNTVNVNPGDNIQALIDTNPAQSTYIIKAGVHRMQTFTPKAGDFFLGEEGAILNGSKVLTGWTQSGATWYVTGQTQETTPSPTNINVGTQSGTGYICILATNPRCNYNEEVFITTGSGEPVLLRHVDSIANVGAGEFFFDYPNNRIYIGNDPAGKTVETSVNNYAIQSGNVDNVTVKNLIIEKYASPAQNGTISSGDTSGWVVEYNTIRYNHGAGLQMGSNSFTRRNIFYRNGQYGLQSNVEDNLTIEYNDINNNGVSGFETSWGAGGFKVARITNSIIQYNYARNNLGKGLWSDIDNKFLTYNNNISVYNSGAGLFHEISFDASIHDNFLGYNSNTALGGNIHAPNLQISNSKNVQAYNNTIVIDQNFGWGIKVGSQDRGNSPIYGEAWQSTNTSVTDNQIYTLRNTSTRYNGIEDVGTGINSLATIGPTLTFDRNTYYVPSASASRWSYGGNGSTGYSFSYFQSQGKDLNSTVVPTSVSTGFPAIPSWNYTVGQQNLSSSICGNSNIETGETCDDGNTISNDGCSSTCQTEISSEPPVTNWQYRKQIVVNESQVPGTSSLANFPVLISITDSNLQTNAQPDGDDIYFTGSDGTTKLAHEIESYNSSTGALVAWVNVPNLSASSNTNLYMYYGNSAAVDQENVAGTWNSNFQGIWHMAENPTTSAPQILNSKTNTNNGTSQGTMVSGDLTPGKIGSSINFDGVDDYITHTVNLPKTTGTISHWLNPDQLRQMVAYYESDGTNSNYNGYTAVADLLEIHTGIQTGNTWNINYQDGSSNANTINNTAVTSGSWTYVAITWNRAGSLIMYVNGNQVASATLSDDIWTTKTPTVRQFGRVGNGTASRHWDGKMDEIRVADTARSIEWIQAEYNNQNNPSAFTTTGTQEILNPTYCGDGTTNTPNGAGVTEVCDDGNNLDNDTCSASCLNACTTPQIWNGSACFNPTLTESGTNYFLLQAENYKAGGEGVAYHDLTAGNSGGAYRNDDVDIKNIGTNQYATGWNSVGEWAEYTVTVPSTGNYNITARAATSEVSGGQLRIDVNGVSYLNVTIPNTGSYNTYADVNVAGGEITSGSKTIRITFIDEWFDLDYLRFDKVVVSCGDGTVNGTEQCDSGVSNGTVCSASYGSSCNYCSLSCTTVTVQGASCGDSTVNGSEQCDNGGSNGTVCTAAYGSSCNYCSSSCQTVSVTGASCGDSTVQSSNGEQCDSGGSNGSVCSASYGGTCNYCDSTCQTITVQGTRCGDGTTQAGNSEQCDSGANNGVVCTPPNGGSCNYCSNSCQTLTINGAQCGDGTVQSGNGEVCDAGVSNGVVCNPAYGGSCNYCTNSCQTVTLQGASCGDSSVNGSEQCDNGSSNGVSCSAPYGGSCNYCSSSCTVTSINGAFCGDSSIQSSNGEQCDSGGSNGELCSPAYGGNCNYCTNSCQTQTLTGSYCGDGITQSGNGETCDAASGNGDICAAAYGATCNYCNNSCTTVTVQGIACGDGTLSRNQGEQCDDNNVNNGDGCDSTCKYEIANATTQAYCGYIDKNEDGKLTLIDFVAFVSSYGKTCVDPNPSDGCRGKDVNSDGRITLADFLSFVLRYGSNSCV